MIFQPTYTAPQLEMFFPEEERRFNIFPCGRRFGKTMGAALACIEWALEGMPILWGDTINANISKYVERYFVPALEADGIKHRWRESKNLLEIGTRGGYIDFRSADNPANWEGFGYRKIVLNEAGLILGDRDGNKGPYLFSNAVLPMMLDFADSQLYAIGVPKGTTLKSGEEHPFFTLWKRCGVDENYRGLRFKSSDNPFIEEEAAAELEKEIATMSPGQQKQEIDAEFIDSVSGELFFHCYEEAKHKVDCARRPLDMHLFSIDFNLHPFCAIMGHVWQDGQGHHAHVTDEIVIKSGTMDEMAMRILTLCPHRHLIRLTGDKGGENERIRQSDNISMFEELRRTLKITSQQLTIHANPRHKVSREQENYVLAHHPDHRIAPRCVLLHADMKTVEVDNEGSIIKEDRTQANQRADLADCHRYWTNAYLSRWITSHRVHPRNDLHKRLPVA